MTEIVRPNNDSLQRRTGEQEKDTNLTQNRKTGVQVDCTPLSKLHRSHSMGNMMATRLVKTGQQAVESFTGEPVVVAQQLQRCVHQGDSGLKSLVHLRRCPRSNTRVSEQVVKIMMQSELYKRIHAHRNGVIQ